MPTRDRPKVPHDYGVPDNDEGLLDWEPLRKRLEEAKYFWISSTGPGAKPYSRPLWGAWVNDRFYFDGSLQTRWGKNLQSNPHIELHLESGSEVVIIEGIFSVMNDLNDASFALVQQSYQKRYESYHPQTMEGLYMIRPLKALAWKEFPKSMTRFHFE